MMASPNGADSYMYGGCGSGTFIGGGGNDVIVLRANCFGPTSAKRVQIVQFGTNTSGKAKQIGYDTDYAGTVGEFIPGTDKLRIRKTLNGGSWSAASVLTAGLTINGNCVFTLNGGSGSMTLTMKGVQCSSISTTDVQTF